MDLCWSLKQTSLTGALSKASSVVGIVFDVLVLVAFDVTERPFYL